jgi:hypothetical protein
MKKLIATAVITCMGLNMQAQYKQSKLQGVSIHAAYGYNAAVTPKNNDNTTNNGFNTLQLGVGYQLIDFWGLNGTYTNSTFKNADNNNLGITYHKIMLEGTYQILAANNSSYTPMDTNSFDVIAHGGFGITFGKSKLTDDTDHIGNFQIGLKPTYYINKSLSVFVDGTYVMNFRQHIDFNGLSNEGSKISTGGFYTALIGLAVHLGN